MTTIRVRGFLSRHSSASEVATPCRPIATRPAARKIAKIRSDSSPNLFWEAYEMAHEIVQIEGALITVRVKGLLRVADMQAMQSLGLDLIRQGKNPRVLILAEDFQGWDPRDDWNDIGFFVEHGNDIERLAFVGDARWKDDIFLFAGKGLRKTEVEFFPTAALEEARNWLRA
jgi:hypothetical protein